jgi:hypothetical protein
MAVEYTVIPAGDPAMRDALSLTALLNNMADEDWAVVTYCQTGLILERIVPDLPENVLRKQYTYSFVECEGHACCAECDVS